MMPKVVSAISILWVAGVCGAGRPTELTPYNSECTIRFPASETKNCRPVRYYYNSETGICEQTCSQNAPFSTKNECGMTCRSRVACFIRRRRRQRCHGRRKVVVFRFDVYRGKCYAKRGCSYRGNNFPTLKECTGTCGAGIGSTEVSGSDDEDSSSLEQQTHEHGPVSQLPVQMQAMPTAPIMPEVPNIGKPPRIPQLPTEKPLLLGVPPSNPAQNPAQPSDTRILSEAPRRDVGYRGPENVIKESSVGPSNIGPSQPVNKVSEVGHHSPTNILQVEKVPPVSTPSTRVPSTTGPVQTPPTLRLPGVSDAAVTSLVAQKDPMCRISHLKFAASNCTHHYYYFNQTNRLCKPTCSETAPFAARSACDKICRSAIVCFYQREEEEEGDCDVRHEATVFSFEPKKGICIKRTGCSTRGNNFPTLRECELTCATYMGSQGAIKVDAGEPNISINKEPPQLPPKQQPTEKPPNAGLVPGVPGKVPSLPSDTGTKPAFPQKDHRCSITVPNVEAKGCKTQKYYFDSRTHLCDPTCSNVAPFQSRSECVGICRSVLVCFFNRAQNICGGIRNITVYYYNPNKGRCMAGKSCTYRGNNFPTLDECRRTCGAFTGIEEPGEEDSSKVIPEISTKPTKEPPNGPETQHNPNSTEPAPTKPPSAAPPKTEAALRPRPSVAGVHEPAQVDSGTGLPTAPSTTPSQEVPIQNQPNTPTVLSSLPQTPMQQPVAQQEVNPPKVSPMQQTVTKPLLSVPTASPVREEAAPNQSRVPNAVVPIPQKQPPKAVRQSNELYIKQQEQQIGSSVTEQPSKEQVTTAVPALLPSSMPQKHTSISPSASQVQKENRPGPTESQKYAQVPKLIPQQTSSGATQINQNLNEIPQPEQVFAQTQPQATEQRLSTIIASPSNQQLVTQQQSAIVVVPNPYQMQDVNNQMFPMYPRALPFGLR